MDTYFKWQQQTYDPIYPLAKKLLTQKTLQNNPENTSNSLESGSLQGGSVESNGTCQVLDSQKLTKQSIEQIETPTVPCFLLRNVLSVEECKSLIDASEQIGYEDAEKFSHLYRDRYNDRLMSDDHVFTQLVFDRVKHLLPQKLHSSKGRLLQLHSLNHRWRYCRYFKGHYFGAHVDGTYHPQRKNVNDPHLMSYLTFMLYLNSQEGTFLNSNGTLTLPTYTGGSTNFVTHKDQDIIYEVKPEPGLALVFAQGHPKTLHEGEKLKSGTKYILRTDVMYSLVESE